MAINLMPRGSDESRRGRPAALASALLILFVPLAFSEEFIEAYSEYVNHVPDRTDLWAFDTMLLGLALLAGMRASRPGARLNVALALYASGAVLTLLLDSGYAPEERNGVGEALAYTVSLGLLSAGVGWTSGLRDDWRDCLRGSAYVLPLLLGTFAAYLGGSYWDAITEGGTANPEAVDKEYFAQVSQVIPLLLVAIGFEARQFQRYARSQVGKAVTVVTVLTLCLGEAMALTALLKPDATGTEPFAGPTWHAYAAFIITLEACFVALAMLVWALIPRQRQRPRRAMERRPVARPVARAIPPVVAEPSLVANPSVVGEDPPPPAVVPMELATSIGRPRPASTLLLATALAVSAGAVAAGSLWWRRRR